MTDPRMTPTNDASVTVEDLTRPIIGIENRTAREAFDIMADRIRTRLAALASAPAGDGVEDEYTYDELWQAIADATRIEGGVIAISVRTFRESIRATDSAAALARPRAKVGERVWVPQIGERVEVTEGTTDAANWRTLALWVAGIRIHDSGDGYDVTVSEQWPIPSRVSGRYMGQTDDFRVGASTVADMLRPLALQSPPAKVEGV